MSYHKDKRTNSTLIQLIDDLCEWERQTGRGSTLILIPHCPDERAVIVVDGKPVRDDDVKEFLEVANVPDTPLPMLLKMAIHSRGFVGRFH